jgi:predicted  nucleic acid-binding Zn-ribbon protein
MGEINDGQNKIKKLTDEVSSFKQQLVALRQKTDQEALDFKSEIAKLQRLLQESEQAAKLA